MSLKKTLSVLGSLVPVLMIANASEGQVVIYSDDFTGGALDDQLTENNYVFEENGSFAPVSELSVAVASGAVRISGVGAIDTAQVSGHDVGWIGRAVSLQPRVSISQAITVEADVTVNSHTINRSAGDAGFVLFLTIEFDENNRIVYNLMESVGLGSQFVQMHLEESGSFLSCFGPTEYCHPRQFSDGETLRLRVDFDPVDRIAAGFIDGVKVLQRPFAGAIADARISFGTAVRAVGDTIDVSFDNLLVTQAGPPTPPGPEFAVHLRQTSPRCVAVLVKHASPITGGEIGVLYDASVMGTASVRIGRDLPREAILNYRDDAHNECPGDAGAARGVTAGWINSRQRDTLPPGEHEVLRICFDPAPTAVEGTCSDLKIVDCLGVTGAPVRNIVTDGDGRSVLLSTTDGEVCIRPETPFRRGDANGDNLFDISDPIAALGCLFVGSDCGTCLDALDTNDDGLVNIADPIFLLSWRFLDGPPPSAPFSACGGDPTSDEVEECEEFTACHG